MEVTVEDSVWIATAYRCARSLFLLRRTGAEGKGVLNPKAEPAGTPRKVSKVQRSWAIEHVAVKIFPSFISNPFASSQLSQAAPCVTCNPEFRIASPVLMIGSIDTRNRTFARQKCIILSEKKAAWSLRAAPDANFCNVCPPPKSKFQIPNQANQRAEAGLVPSTSPTPPSSGHPAPRNSTLGKDSIFLTFRHCSPRRTPQRRNGAFTCGYGHVYVCSQPPLGRCCSLTWPFYLTLQCQCGRVAKDMTIQFAVYCTSSYCDHERCPNCHVSQSRQSR